MARGCSAQGTAAGAREHRPASLLARLVAALLDGAFGIAVVAFSVRDAQGRPWVGAMLTARGGLGVWCGVGWLYTVVFERSALQATPGKVVLNVRVQPLAGGRMGVWASALRNAFRLIDLQPCLAYWVGGVAAMRSPLRQRFGDRVANTVVTRHRFTPVARIICTLVLTVPVMALVRSYRRRPPLAGPGTVAGLENELTNQI